MPAYSNYRFDVVTGSYLPVEINDEQHTAYLMEEINRYGFIVDEIPYFESPSSVTLIRQSDSQEFTEVPLSQAPGALEFSIDYQNRANNYGTGTVILDAAYDDVIFEISYKGLGSTLKVRTVRETVTTVPNLLSLEGGAYISNTEVLAQDADRPDLTTITNEIDAIRDTDFSKLEWQLDGGSIIDDTANGGSRTTLLIGGGGGPGDVALYEPSSTGDPALDPQRTHRKRVNYGDTYFAKFVVRCPDNPGGEVSLVATVWDGDQNTLGEISMPILTADAADHLPSGYCDVCVPLSILNDDERGVTGMEPAKYIDIKIYREFLENDVWIKSFELSKVNIFTKSGVFHYLEMSGFTDHYGLSSSSVGRCDYIGIDGASVLNGGEYIEGSNLFPGMVTLVNYMITSFDIGDGSIIGAQNDGGVIFERTSSSSLDVPVLCLPGPWDTSGVGNENGISVYNNHPTGEITFKVRGFWI